MKKVFVTGSDGMLGTEVMRLLARDKNIATVASTINDLDVTNLAQVKATLYRERPTHLIHCAAYTFVDNAEKDTLKAYQINAEGTKNLAFFCRELETELIYLSTDYVFAGDKSEPYIETDRPNPLNVYGMSKLLGEIYVQTLLEKHKIVRTSWLNGLGGDFTRNFIETMLRVSETRSSLSLVNDQIGRPTFTFDLALALVTLLDVNSYGIYHVTNGGQCSWHDFAKEIFLVADKQNVSVRPILSEQFRSQAKRPAYSVLANRKYESLGLKPLPDWKDSLREYFRRRNATKLIDDAHAFSPSPKAMRT
ncbi:dTDP-4-dehydrorhamnose reductase [soil metagenome]